MIKILAVIGSIESIVLIIGIIWAIAMWTKGVAPALLRLGNGLARRKVAIFAKGDNLLSLKKLLIDSKLFSARNICEITKGEDIGAAEQATLYVVFWHDWINSIDEILKKKADGCALIVYAPRDLGHIPEDQMKKLDGHRNSAVTNFRGRLLNDIVTAMITTSYEK